MVFSECSAVLPGHKYLGKSLVNGLRDVSVWEIVGDCCVETDLKVDIDYDSFQAYENLG